MFIRNCWLLAILFAVSGGGAFAQHARALSAWEGASRVLRNPDRRPAAARDGRTQMPHVISIPGDSVIPQLVDGGTWQTALTFVNLDSKLLHFTVYFIGDSGDDLEVDLVGLGPSYGVEVSLGAGQTRSFETRGTSGTLRQGWAYIERDDLEDVLGGLCVFRQRVPGRPDFEAVVPVVSEIEERVVLLYDNTNGYVTAMAVANSWPMAVTVSVEVRTEDGRILEQPSMRLGAFEHRAFTLPNTWATSANRRGVVEFRAPGFSISVLGLRFNPGGAFTSFHVLSNPDWLLEGSGAK
jgi:hypothetical protein